MIVPFDLSGLKSGWKKLWGQYKYVLPVVLAGVVLLLLPGGERTQRKEMTAQTEECFDLEAMERKLEQALSRVSGVGEVTVVLTLKESGRRVLARDTQVSERDQRSQTVVLSSGSGTEETVTLQNIYPNYQGALVVCDGGDDPAVRLCITKALSALTGLGADKITVCK